MVVKRVAVIGAGVSGLVSIKTCLEDGFEPVCFEREDRVGGVWVFRDEVREDHEESALYHALVTNSSKEMMCYSDFPFPKDCPPYIPGKRLGKYYEDYAEHFGLLKHIRFNTKVLDLQEATDYDTTGRWLVTTEGPGGQCTEVFDAVMVCTGMFSKAKMPTYPGQSDFEGEIRHSNDYRKADEFADKTVLVVGGSHSAGDVAVDTSRKSKKTYISMRNGTWVITRTGPMGWPRDLFMNRRINFHLPEWIRRNMVEKDLSTRLNVDNLGLRSTRKLFCSEVMVNDDIANRIFCGALSAKPGIKYFTKKGVVFTDGTKIDNLDAVIYATGYNIKVPFVGTHLVAAVQHERAPRSCFARPYNVPATHSQSSSLEASVASAKPHFQAPRISPFVESHQRPIMSFGSERSSCFVPVVPEYMSRLPAKSTNQDAAKFPSPTTASNQQPAPLPHMMDVQRLAMGACVSKENAMQKQESKPTYLPLPGSTVIHPFSTNSNAPLTSHDLLYEGAARLLFMTIKWARGMPAFLTLPFSDQAILLEESWAELFILGACQWSLSAECGQLFSTETLNSLKNDQSDASIHHDVRILQDIVCRVRELQTDPMEFACLKALTLFRPDSRGLREVLAVERLQDETQLTLAEYNHTHYMTQRARFGKLLLLLPSVRSVRSKTLENLYFRRTIGSVPIGRLLCDMFKSC